MSGARHKARECATMSSMSERDWPTESEVRRWLRVRDMLIEAHTGRHPRYSVRRKRFELPPIPGRQRTSPRTIRWLKPEEFQAFVARLAAELAEVKLPVPPNDRVTEALMCWKLYLEGNAVRSLSTEFPDVLKGPIGRESIVRSHMWLSVDSPVESVVRRRGYRASWPAMARICSLLEEVCDGVVSGEVDEAAQQIDAFATSVRSLSRSLAELIPQRVSRDRESSELWIDLDVHVTLVGPEVIELPQRLRVNGLDLRGVTISGLEHLEVRGAIRMEDVKCSSVHTIVAGGGIEVSDGGTHLPSLTTVESGGDMDLDLHPRMDALRTIRCGGVLEVSSGFPLNELPQDLAVGCHIHGAWVPTEEIREQIDTWNSSNARCSCNIEPADTISNPRVD